MAAEKQLQNQILRQFATRSDLRLWRANAGVGTYVDADGNERRVRFGIKGQADLSGILPGGVRLEIEVKGPRGRQTDEQRAFQGMIEHMGGVYVLARAIEDVERAIKGHLTCTESTCGAYPPPPPAVDAAATAGSGAGRAGKPRTTSRRSRRWKSSL